MKQIAFTSRSHQFANINAWTPDNQWLVFDVRPSGASSTDETIEHINIHTGELEVVYRATQGPYVGVMTVYPSSEKYVFIHGSESPDGTWHYDFHHRCGVITTQAGVEDLDAMDITAPYTSDMLCGGSHVHVFNPNSKFVSFAYSNHVLHERLPASDLCNIGMAAPYGPVNVSTRYPCGYNGSHWCMLVSQTAPAPKPGSDGINRAYEEGRVGGNRLVFIGDTLSATGEKAPKLFIVDLSQDESGWRQPRGALLGGANIIMFASSPGIRQRRLTFTHERTSPGLVNQPRHWVHSNPEIFEIAFSVRDDNGTVQLWLIPPQDGSLCQLTRCATNIQSAFNWCSSGK